MELNRFAFLILIVLLVGCSQEESIEIVTLFKRISSDSSGVNFTNNLTFDSKFNIYTYRNFYNGGGVGLADINNDGLMDIYFSANHC